MLKNVVIAFQVQLKCHFFSKAFSQITFPPSPNRIIQSTYLIHLQSIIAAIHSGSVVKNPPANAGDEDLIPGQGRSSREGNGNPSQYSSLENSMDRGAWRATVGGVTKESDTI